MLIEREKAHYPPEPPGARESFRMDLVATGVPGVAQRLSVDPTITNPTVPTMLANAALRQGYAANQVQEAKIVKYQQYIPTYFHNTQRSTRQFIVLLVRAPSHLARHPLRA